MSLERKINYKRRPWDSFEDNRNRDGIFENQKIL